MTIPEPVGVTRPRHFRMPWATGMAYLASGIWIAAVQSFDPGSSRLERRYARIWLDGYLGILVFAFVRGVPLSICVAIVVATTSSDDDDGVRSTFSTPREDGKGTTEGKTNAKKGE